MVDIKEIERFEALLDTYPSQIEMSEYHYNRLLNLKGFKIEKVINEKRENIQKIKLNNLFMLR